MPELYKIELERDGLHRNLGGGFPKGAIVLMIGKYGAGKSAVSQRLTYGFLKNGHSVTMVSTEFTTKAFLETGSCRWRGWRWRATPHERRDIARDLAPRRSEAGY